MQRRRFLQRGTAAAIGFAIGGCATNPQRGAAPGSQASRRHDRLVPVRCSRDRVLRSIVGLRPHREGGFLVGAEQLDATTVIHNYGHGGAGWSLSWGTAALAADLAVSYPSRRAAVIGCGIIGLTTARTLQRRGFSVTIYAEAVPPGTTSDRAFACFTPIAGLVSAEVRSARWDEQFSRAVRIAYREHQRLLGPRYGVGWIDEYHLADDLSRTVPLENPLAMLLPPETVGRTVVLGPGEHPFGSPYATWRRMLRFEPPVYLAALVDDFLTAGGRIVLRGFAAAADLTALAEPIVVNCTGLGAGALVGDATVIPVRGQLTLLAPQPEVDYMVAGMLPRRDAIVLSGGMESRGDWSLEVSEAHEAWVLELYQGIFDRMRQPPI